MPVVVVANPKGGVGKSTLSTNIAGYLARQGHAVMLGDVDRQQSSRAWLQLRPGHLPRIATWDVTLDHRVKPPKGTTHVVLDTPAGLHGKKLEEVGRLADKIVVPLQPSLFDIYATRDFIDAVHGLAKGARAAKPDKPRTARVAVVGNRVREGTIAADQLATFLGTLGVPVLGALRDTQNYVHLAARGLSLWDVAVGRVEKDLDQWQPITGWLDA